MVAGILVGLILVSGVLAGLGKHKAGQIIKAVIFVSCETLIGSVLFEVLTILFLLTNFESTWGKQVESLFLAILLIAILNGIIMYWLNRALNVRFKISAQVRILSEYVIQWSLIYITIYQVMFDNVLSVLKNENFVASDIKRLNLTDPADLVILILPSLISVWIALVLEKLRTDEL